jgi:hypothetical protein
LLLLAAAVARAQTRRAWSIEVSETAGIRRTEYPTSARVELPRGALPNPSAVRLRLGDADVPAQFTAAGLWEDRSVRSLDVDFNVSIGPAERRTYQLEIGAGPGTAAVARGLAVSQTDDAIQAGNLRFGTRGSPLVQSAAYVKSEFIGSGPNGLAVVDAAGVRHDLSSAAPLSVEIVKRGPLNATVRYRGQFPIDAGYAAPFVILLEAPNSKSWLKMSAVVDDPARRLRRIVFDSPLALGAHPWTWDFATPNGTYGAFRAPTDTAVLLQTVNEKGAAGWTVNTGTEGETLRAYETSADGASKGTGHLVGARAAVAFGIDRFGQNPGVYRVGLNGQGQANFSFEPSSPATEHRLTVYQHFVSTPVPIGAATSPAAMLAPLGVSVQTKAP